MQLVSDGLGVKGLSCVCVLVHDRQEVSSGHHSSYRSRPGGVKDLGNQRFREWGPREMCLGEFQGNRV